MRGTSLVPSSPLEHLGPAAAATLGAPSPTGRMLASDAPGESTCYAEDGDEKSGTDVNGANSSAG